MTDNQDYITKTYTALKDNLQGFNKTEQEFRDNMLSDPAYRAKVHTALTDNVQGFQRTPEEFDSLVGIKKKAVPYPNPLHQMVHYLQQLVVSILKQIYQTLMLLLHHKHNPHKPRP